MQRINQTSLISAVALLLAALFAYDSINASTYQYDDGTTEASNSIGSGSFHHMSWGNVFEVNPLAATLISIEFGFGDRDTAGRQITWRIFGSSTYDIRNATLTLLDSGNHNIINSFYYQSGRADVILLDGLDISNHSHFFVTVDYLGKGLAVAGDRNEILAGHSWWVPDSGSAESWKNSEYIGERPGSINQNWLVRANAVPEPASLLLLAMGLCIPLRHRR